jgi:hypothetical protein
VTPADARSRPAALTASLLRDRRELNNGFGEALSRAFELAFTPAIFALLGQLLDRRLGTSPGFTIGFFVVVVVYLGWKFFVRYDADMREHERRLGARHEEDA